MTTAAAARPRSALAAAPLLLVLLLLLCNSIINAFVVPPALRPPRAAAAATRPQHGLRMSAQQQHGAAAKRALATASALLLGSGGLSMMAPLSPPPAAQAADLSGLPSEVQETLKAARNTEDPFLLRDAIKQLSEYPGLDELAFDDSARRAVNTELKELQRASPELWDAETSYYGGVVRRTVNPFHVIEVIPLLKAGPFIGGLGYVVAILVQRKFPRFFAIAYFGAIASLVGPAVYLILNT